jgi:hypothetical protein
MEEIYLHSLPIKEYQIVDFFLPKLKDEVMKVRSIQTRRVTTQNLVDHGIFLLTCFSNCRSSQCRSKLVPVSVPVSRLSF